MSTVLRAIARSLIVSLALSIALTVALAIARSAGAQAAPASSRPWEVRVTSGALIATGDQRQSVTDAQLTALQLSWRVRESLALTATGGWARSRDRVINGTPRLDVFTADLGAEMRAASRVVTGRVSFSPLAGLGVGMRSYNHRSLDTDATHNVAGYVAAGGELGMGPVGIRLEVRDYATGFTPLTGSGAAQARNDLMVMGSLRVIRRAPSPR